MYWVHVAQAVTTCLTAWRIPTWLSRPCGIRPTDNPHYDRTPGDAATLRKPCITGDSRGHRVIKKGGLGGSNNQLLPVWLTAMLDPKQQQ